MNPAERLTALRTSGGFFALGSRALFRLSGPDAARYLNGQVTRDVTRLPEGGGAACLLTAKGKLVAPLWIFPKADGFLIEAPWELRDETSARLDRYLVADDAVLEDVSSESDAWHIFGPHVAGTLRRTGLPGKDVAERPTQGLEACPTEIEVLRITAGVPLWARELSPDTLVQEARLEGVAVDFDKGCYVGQEVVSRLKSVGRVNRRLALLRGDAEAAPGDRLMVGDAPPTPAGEITSAAFDFELSQTVALGYVLRAFEASPSFRVVDPTGKDKGCLGQLDFPN